MAKNPITAVANAAYRNNSAHAFRAAAFSLIELLAYLCIVSILLLFAFPQLHYLVQKSNLDSRTSELLLSIKSAKVASIDSHRSVMICRKRIELACQGGAGRGKHDWSNGWLVFTDTNGDKIYQQSEQLIKATRFNRERCTITWNRGDYVNFHKFGVLKGARAGSFVINCGQLTTKLVINWLGRVRVETK
ncbi:MAG: hypothetical protein OFPII_22280 [Osedax symbiont Rs1]|nr:MAG: hypothetical protein OFPII_22280 [Osedax symbiont Rs1]